VNQVAGSVPIRIQETTTFEASEVIIMEKNNPSLDSGEATQIGNFTANPAQVARDGVTTLSWKTTNAVAATLWPGGIPIPNPNEGSIRIPVAKSMLFTLIARGSGGSDEAQVAVTVLPVAIQELTATPRESDQPGSLVTLKWKTHFAQACLIDQGVGPVPTTGQTVVAPQRTTVYTLTAIGLESQTSSVRVHVSPQAFP
jgi:hypothetical protein